MNDKYILERLKKWVPLFYGKDKKEFAFAFVETAKVERGVFQKIYHFGYDDGNESVVVNMISKAVALYLITGLPTVKEEKPKNSIHVSSTITKRVRRNKYLEEGMSWGDFQT